MLLLLELIEAAIYLLPRFLLVAVKVAATTEVLTTRLKASRKELELKSRSRLNTGIQGATIYKKDLKLLRILSSGMTGFWVRLGGQRKRRQKRASQGRKLSRRRERRRS
jgi:hypothetical protein